MQVAPSVSDRDHRDVIGGAPATVGVGCAGDVVVEDDADGAGGLRVDAPSRRSRRCRGGSAPPCRSGCPAAERRVQASAVEVGVPVRASGEVPEVGAVGAAGGLEVADRQVVGGDGEGWAA